MILVIFSNSEKILTQRIVKVGKINSILHPHDTCNTGTLFYQQLIAKYYYLTYITPIPNINIRDNLIQSFIFTFHNIGIGRRSKVQSTQIAAAAAAYAVSGRIRGLIQVPDPDLSHWYRTGEQLKSIMQKAIIVVIVHITIQRTTG